MQNHSWLVVEPYPAEKDESQLELLFPIYGKNVSNYAMSQGYLLTLVSA